MTRQRGRRSLTKAPGREVLFLRVQPALKERLDAFAATREISLTYAAHLVLTAGLAELDRPADEVESFG